MEITETASGLKKTVVISEVGDDDYKILTKKRYFFNWKLFKNTTKLYKLQLPDSDDILGVMNCIDVPKEKRIEIKLLACSIENTGKHKVYEGIAGCLIAYACRMAAMKYGDLACVSLLPKTVLKTHYIQKYQMIDGGWQLYLEGRYLSNIVKKYLL